MSEDATGASVSRRGLLRAGSGAAILGVSAGTATAQEDGQTVQVDLVNYAFEPGTSEALTIPPGTTVNFVWQTDNHNIEIDAAPAESEWEGVSEIHNSGYETQHTFEVTGTYEFFCRPHLGQGMTGTIVVEEGASLPGEGVEIPPAVSDEAKALAVGTAGALVATLGFAYLFLKYGGEPHPEE